MSKKVEFEAKVVRAQQTCYDSRGTSITDFSCIDVSKYARSGQRCKVTLEYIVPEPDSCPFCGGGAECLEYSAGNSFEWEVECMGCGAKSGRWDSPEMATEQWNHRWSPGDDVDGYHPKGLDD